MQREASSSGGLPLLNLNPAVNKLSQSSLESHSRSNFYQNEVPNNKVETDGVDINELENTSMTDVNPSGFGGTNSAK